MGFNMLFYIIFGTNLLTGGPTQIDVFAYFSVSQKRNIKRSPNGMKPLGELFLEQTQSRRLGVDVKKQSRRPRGREVRPHPCGPLVAPLTDFLRLYISTYHENIQEHHEILLPLPPFCTREIPSSSIFRRSAGGGIDHGGLLHQHHSLSDDV